MFRMRASERSLTRSPSEWFPHTSTRVRSSAGARARHVLVPRTGTAQVTITAGTQLWALPAASAPAVRPQPHQPPGRVKQPRLATKPGRHANPALAPGISNARPDITTTVISQLDSQKLRDAIWALDLRPPASSLVLRLHPQG
jgi:hypothetical protein